MSSSESPSEKNSWSWSSLKSTNGNTAIVEVPAAAWGAARLAARSGTWELAFPAGTHPPARQWPPGLPPGSAGRASGEVSAPARRPPVAALRRSSSVCVSICRHCCQRLVDHGAPRLSQHTGFRPARSRASEQFVQHHAKRVDITAQVDGLAAQQLRACVLWSQRPAVMRVIDGMSACAWNSRATPKSSRRTSPFSVTNMFEA